MGKAIATTYINFGLVNIPRRIETLARDENIKFNIFFITHMAERVRKIYISIYILDYRKIFK
jgi:non-homologous end joining protein Ku